MTRNQSTKVEHEMKKSNWPLLGLMACSMNVPIKRTVTHSLESQFVFIFSLRPHLVKLDLWQAFLSAVFCVVLGCV